MNTQTKLLIPLLLLTAYAGIITWQFINKSDYVPPGQVDEMIDKNTRALSAQIRSAEEIRDSIASVSKAQAARIDSLKEQITVYAGIQGTLNIYKDSLQTLNNRIRISDLLSLVPTSSLSLSSEALAKEGGVSQSVKSIESAIPTHHFTQTFTDSLFLVTSQLRVEDEYLYNDLDLTQLRPLDIRFTVTENPNGQLTLYTYLPDFDASEQYVWHPPREDKKHWAIRRWKEIALLSAGAYILISP
jgi:hypothetical protein